MLTQALRGMVGSDRLCSSTSACCVVLRVWLDSGTASHRSNHDMTSPTFLKIAAKWMLNWGGGSQHNCSLRYLPQKDQKPIPWKTLTCSIRGSAAEKGGG